MFSAVAAACNDWKARHSVADENGEAQEVEEDDIYAVKEVGELNIHMHHVFYHMPARMPVT